MRQPAGPKDSLPARLALAMANRRFRGFVLLISAVPIALAYGWASFLRPLVFPGHDTPDLFYVYLYSAGKLAAGHDPYSTCLSIACWNDLTTAGSPYPPVVSWLFVPFVHLDHGLVAAAGLVAAQACVALFLWTTLRGLDLKGWQPATVAAIAVITFPPLMGELVNRNLEVLMLALSGVWFLGYLAGDRWWGGAAAGAAVALKLVQAPMFLLGVWRRRVRMSLAGGLTSAALWLIGAPQYLIEYLVKVAPGLDTGTGFAMNVAPIATIARVLHPGSMYGYGTGVDTGIRVAAYVIAAGVVVLTLVALGPPRSDRAGRALEAAAVVSASPLVIAIVRPGHLILLLLPCLVLGTTAIRARDWPGLAAVVASWALMGPVYLWSTQLLAVGAGLPYTRVGAETALLGAVVLWLGSLRALRVSVHAAAAKPKRLLGEIQPTATRA